METFKINRIPRLLQLTGIKKRTWSILWYEARGAWRLTSKTDLKSLHSSAHQCPIAFPEVALLYPSAQATGKLISGLWEGTRLHSAVNHDHDHVKVIRLEVANWDVVTFVIIINIFHIQFSPLFLLYRTPERFVIMLVLIFLAALLSVQHSSAETKVRTF